MMSREELDSLRAAAAYEAGLADADASVATVNRYSMIPATGWDIARMAPDPGGEWVRYEDVASAPTPQQRDGGQR